MKIPKSEAEHRIRRYDELEEKHWSECVQISQYEEENRKLKELLREAEKLLVSALWVNYNDRNAEKQLRKNIGEVLNNDKSL